MNPACRHAMFNAIVDAFAADLVVYLLEEPDLVEAWLEWAHGGVEAAERRARQLARELGAAA